MTKSIFYRLYFRDEFIIRVQLGSKIMKVIDSKIIDSHYEEFAKVPDLDYNLAYGTVLGLSKDTSKEHIYDY